MDVDSEDDYIVLDQPYMTIVYLVLVPSLLSFISSCLAYGLEGFIMCLDSILLCFCCWLLCVLKFHRSSLTCISVLKIDNGGGKRFLHQVPPLKIDRRFSYAH